ncbi:MAG: hypothetical protein MJ184_12955 [Treponema sp.]|uniref:hypothetical protein n=1 Tax=Treponema sp. TaxID=166 RepID=UPI00298EC929|nr:hypothetical protein [Treponema sp.]MCQ2602263.1 hypothetical protein [Treponema sp.]
MRISDEGYIPIELYHEAKDFVQRIDEDVEIYKKIKSFSNTKPCLEADKFCAYWILQSYENFPHALITLYENKNEIDDRFGPSDALTVIDCMQFRFKSYYELLKANNMIED